MMTVLKNLTCLFLFVLLIASCDDDEDIKTKMEKGGSPMRVMGRAELKEMWQQRQAFLKELFENLDGAELEQAK